MISDPNRISDSVINYYKNLYAATLTSTDTSYCSLIPSIVTEEENLSLIAMPSEKEITAVVFSIDPTSAPGPDEFSGLFYQTCWDIIRSDVCGFVLQFFAFGKIYRNLNSSFVALIPKMEGANSVTHFRPIAMANFCFKIITKIIADRLNPIANRVVSPQQSTFIKGRHISDCIGMVSETINILDKKSFGGNVAIKIDIVKAFDTIDWSFLLQVLRSFGFHNTLINWVRVILESAHLFILINGTPKGFFPCSRGVRQGDPLSPLLFCLAADVLSKGITFLIQEAKVKPISSPQGCSPASHVLYADDVIIFCRSDSTSLHNLR